MKVKIPNRILDLYKTCIKRNGDFNARKLNSIYHSDQVVFNWFIAASSKVGFSISPELIFYTSIKNGLNYYEPKLCLTCKKPLTAKQIRANSDYCSLACAAQSKEVRNKTKQTMLNRYGSEHALQVKQFKDKYKKTNLDRYGAVNPYAADSIKSKIKQTFQSKYGQDNPAKVESIKRKIKETNLKRYKAENPQQNQQIKEKTQQTNLAKYGSKSPLASKEIRAKSVKTWKKTLGVDNPSKSKKVVEKIKQTNLKKYGAVSPAQNSIIASKIKKTQREHFYEAFKSILLSKHIQLLSSKEDYISFKPLKLKCLNCNQVWTNSDNPYQDNYQHIFCKHCYSESYRSNQEIALADFVKSVCKDEVITNARNVIPNQELDIYVPSKKLAIEFDGAYYHSALFKSYDYHQKKTLACRELGIRLIHVFEHEWIAKQEKVKNLIRSALGLFEHIVYARQCTIKELSSEQYRLFLDINHFNGAINSTIRYGLFYKDELVSAIGFGKSRFKKGEIELHRYCVKANYRVIGGFSKLLKYSNQTEFYSYVDLAHFSGQGYEALGFSLVEITQPSYVYASQQLHVLTRLACQKHKLSKVLGAKFDPNLSESENMQSAGWYKIYDCGNLKLKYNKKEQI